MDSSRQKPPDPPDQGPSSDPSSGQTRLSTTSSASGLGGPHQAILRSRPDFGKKGSVAPGSVPVTSNRDNRAGGARENPLSAPSHSQTANFSSRQHGRPSTGFPSDVPSAAVSTSGGAGPGAAMSASESIGGEIAMSGSESATTSMPTLHSNTGTHTKPDTPGFSQG